MCTYETTASTRSGSFIRTKINALDTKQTLFDQRLKYGWSQFGDLALYECGVIYNM